MCSVCEHPCWRDGGERDCPISDEEFEEMMDLYYYELNSDGSTRLPDAFVAEPKATPKDHSPDLPTSVSRQEKETR